MPSTFALNSSTIGVDLNNMNATALFALGTHVLGVNNTEWVYVQAQTTIGALSWVAVNSTFSAGMASAADVLVASNQIAVANATISASSYGWVAIRGDNLSALFTGTGSLAPTSGQFQLASSAGPTGVVMLGTVGTASCTLAGVGLSATASASASGLGVGIGGQLTAANVMLCNLYWPVVKTT